MWRGQWDGLVTWKGVNRQCLLACTCARTCVYMSVPSANPHLCLQHSWGETDAVSQHSAHSLDSLCLSFSRALSHTFLSFSLCNLTAGFFWIPRFLCRVSSVTPFKLSYSLRDTATTTWGASPNHSLPGETGLWVVHTVAAVGPESNSGQRSGGKRSPPVSQHMSFATCAQSVLSLWRKRG